VPLPFGVSLILREAVPSTRLEEVALFGRNYRDDEAVSSGLAHQVCPAGSLMEQAEERLREMTGKDLSSFAVTKRYLRSATVERIEAREAEFHHQFLDCWFSPGTQKRIGQLVDQLTGRRGVDA
jgi:enoyl-CoA hydratase/carnithine racemase